MLYPLKFKPLFLEKIWGGRRLQTVLGKQLPPGKLIGESWEIYDFPPGFVQGSQDWLSAEIANGPLAGRTLHWAVQQFGPALHGQVPLIGQAGQFPILIKFLDAREDLSIQVHPDLRYAREHPEAHVKTEAWYVIDSQPGARLLHGLLPGTTRETFRQAISQGSVEQAIRAFPARPGDCYYLPSGTVHALGAGILVAEIQTPSDTTFRVFDFNRIDPSTGRPRPLHVDQAVECIDFDRAIQPQQARSHVASFFTTATHLLSTPHFTIEKVRFSEGVQQPLPYDQPVIWIILAGQAEVSLRGLEQPARFGVGDTVLLPPEMDNPVLRTLADCTWLEITFPVRTRPPSESP